MYFKSSLQQSLFKSDGVQMNCAYESEPNTSFFCHRSTPKLGGMHLDHHHSMFALLVPKVIQCVFHQGFVFSLLPFLKRYHNWEQNFPHKFAQDH
jgi:hypothetical protein